MYKLPELSKGDRVIVYYMHGYTWQNNVMFSGTISGQDKPGFYSVVSDNGDPHAIWSSDSFKVVKQENSDMYKHGNGRLQRRNSGGRFERSTLQNTFGLYSQICPACGAINVSQPVYYTDNGFVTKAKYESLQFCETCGQDFNESPESAFNTLIMLG